MGCCDKLPDEAPVRPTTTPSGGSPQVVTVTSSGGSPQVVDVTPISVRPSSGIARVDLQAPSDLGQSTVNLPLPPVFYVIVGRGPAATIDHTTLLQSSW